jgi:hypothetical protein
LGERLQSLGEVGRNEHLPVDLSGVELVEGIGGGQYTHVEPALVHPAHQSVDDLCSAGTGVVIDYGDREMPKIAGGVEDAPRYRAASAVINATEITIGRLQNRTVCVALGMASLGGAACRG